VRVRFNTDFEKGFISRWKSLVMKISLPWQRAKLALKDAGKWRLEGVKEFIFLKDGDVIHFRFNPYNFLAHFITAEMWASLNSYWFIIN